MLKENRRTLLLTSVVILLPVLAGVFLWNRLPDTVPTHWNAAGQIDGYSAKTFAVIGIPVIMLALQWLCLLLSHYGMRKKEQNHKLLTLVWWIVPCICLVVQTLILCAALGCAVDVSTWCCLLLGVLLVLIGNYLPKCRQNRFLGIRVKWTLENEANWNATHRFGGKVWVLGGLGFFLCLLLPGSIRFIAVLCLSLLLVLLPIVYAWRFHKKHP